MTPSARLAAVIELLDAIESARLKKRAAADTIIDNYFRKRRYAGSQDRRAVRERVFGILRRRGELSERLTRAGAAIPSMRLFALLDLGLSGEDSSDLHIGEHAVSPPDEAEARLLQKALAIANLSEAARQNLPPFLSQGLKARFGDDLEDELAALSGRAPLDLRVNGLRSNRDKLIAALETDGIMARPTPMSPQGLRIESPVHLESHALFRAGKFEVQDEASQIAVLLAGAAPGLQVAELGAGAGGKTLALGVEMKNSGQIYAFDTDKARLEELKKRADRAHLTNVQCHRLTTGAERREQQLFRFTGQMDLVLVDAPCSGSGTWRRSPDLRWRYDADDIRAFATLQRSLLREALALAKPGGRIAYMTCSLLKDENEVVIETVLRSARDRVIEDYRDRLADAGLGHLPPSAASDPRMWLSTPHRHNMDGFFLCLIGPRQ